MTFAVDDEVASLFKVSALRAAHSISTTKLKWSLSDGWAR